MWPKKKKKKKKKKKNGAVKRSFFCQPTTNFGHPALIRAIIDDLLAAHDHLITMNIFQSIHVNTSNSPDKLSGFAEQNLDFLSAPGHVAHGAFGKRQCTKATKSSKKR